MFMKALFVTALGLGLWTSSTGAQTRPIWLCAGAKPSWSLQFAVDSASWQSGSEMMTLRGFTTLEPEEQRTANRIWVYQLNDRGVRLTLVVQENERTDCPYSEVSPQVPRFFTGIFITHSRVYIGCCRHNSDQ
jgi:hypothetical protein